MNHKMTFPSETLEQRVHALFLAESERWARLYAQHDVFSVIMQDRHSMVLSMVGKLRLPPRARILDVGCGAGVTSVALAKQGYQVDALDSVRAMIALVQRRSVDEGVSDRVRPVLGDVNRLPFASNTFDAVVALGVAPWLPDVSRAMSEIERVLSPGGNVIISGDNPLRIGDLIDPALNPVLAPLKRVVRSTLSGLGFRPPSSLPHPRLYSQQSFLGLLEEVGLQPTDCRPFGFGPITFLHRPILSDDRGVRIHRTLQAYCDGGISLLGHVASQYLAVARRPSTGGGLVMKKIGLLGPFGVGNLGDAAIQQAMIQNISRLVPGAHVHGFSLNPGETEHRHHIRSFPIARIQKMWLDRTLRPGRGGPFRQMLGRIQNTPLIRFMRRALLRAPAELPFLIRSYRSLKGFDLLIISGGGQLDDSWGGPWMHPYTLFKWTLLARLTRTRVIFTSVGAGPVDSRLSRLFIKAALGRASYRSYRDEDSRRFLEQIGFRNNDFVYPDLAHSLEASNGKSRSKGRTSSLVVGICPVPYLHPEEWPQHHPTVYREYVSKLAAFCTMLLREGHNIVFFPGSLGADSVVISDIKTVLAQNGESMRLVSEPVVHTVDDLLGVIARTNVVVASRFHGVLLSHLMHKPVLAISPHRKVDALMSEMGHSEYCVDINTFDASMLWRQFLRIVSARAGLAKQIARKEETYRRALDEQYRRIFTPLRGSRRAGTMMNQPRNLEMAVHTTDNIHE